MKSLFKIKDLIRSDKLINIGGIMLPLNLTNPHEKLYFKSIKNDDYYIAQTIIDSGSRVLDLGANIGFTTLLYLLHGASEVYAFEPVKNLYQRLEKLDSNRIKSFNMAIADFTGESEIYLSDTHNQGHSLNVYWPKKFQKVFKRKKTELIHVTTLDDFFDKDSKFDFIKIDVEGMEAEVFEGGHNFFRNNQDSIVQVEIYEWQFEQTIKAIRPYYSKTYIPKRLNNEVLIMLEINEQQVYNSIEFDGAPNFIFSNKNLNL